MTYAQALAYIHGLHRFGSKPGLERIAALLAGLGHPEARLDFLHVAGTNGKGSVTAMLAAALEEHGLSTGRYTSPYLERWNERISLNGLDIPDADVAALAERVRPVADGVGAALGSPLTEFEVVTAMALDWFASRGAEAVAWETGLGGRFDATNIVQQPLVAVITNIGFDHMDVLGDTLAAIAAEKAGIIKPGRPVVTGAVGEALEVIADTAARLGSALTTVGPAGGGATVQWAPGRAALDGQELDVSGPGWALASLRVPLLGAHQLANAAIAVAALKQAGVSDGAIRRGLARVRWPGRLEVLSRAPLVVIDGAHNADGAEALRRAIEGVFHRRPNVLVLGILADKSVEAMVERLVPLADRVICTEPLSPRALPADRLAELVSRWGVPAEAMPAAEGALARGLELAGESGFLLVTGSLYLVGHARGWLRAALEE